LNSLQLPETLPSRSQVFTKRIFLLYGKARSTPIILLDYGPMHAIDIAAMLLPSKMAG
jgi:hypothetical protein